MKENIFSIKINGKIYDTDKSNELLSRYNEHFKDYNSNEVKLLELGVRNGGSMLFWNDYFNTSKIIGLDLDQVVFDKDYPNLKVYEGSQANLDLLDEIRQDNAREGFDIIIDDCSHIAELTKISFWHIFNNHLKNGGLYVIEDWGCGYWSKWPDGHKYKAPRQSIIRQTLDNLISYLLKMELSPKTIKKINWLFPLTTNISKRIRTKTHIINILFY